MNIRTKSPRALGELLSIGKNTKAKTSLTGMTSVSWRLPGKYLFSLVRNQPGEPLTQHCKVEGPRQSLEFGH